MQLYMQYAWFYLVMRPTPDFQAESQKTVLDIARRLIQK
jgi:hypothetical protein